MIAIREREDEGERGRETERERRETERERRETEKRGIQGAREE